MTGNHRRSLNWSNQAIKEMIEANSWKNRSKLFPSGEIIHVG